MKDAKIHDLEPTRRAGGIDGIDKMFYVVDEQDRQDGEAPESVNNLDPAVGEDKFVVFSIMIALKLILLFCAKIGFF